MLLLLENQELLKDKSLTIYMFIFFCNLLVSFGSNILGSSPINMKH